MGGLRGDPGLTPWYSDMFTSTQATYSGFASRNPASLLCSSRLLRSLHLLFLIPSLFFPSALNPFNDQLVVDLALTGNRTKMEGYEGFKLRILLLMSTFRRY